MGALSSFWVCVKIMRHLYILEVDTMCEKIRIGCWLDFCPETEQEMKALVLLVVTVEGEIVGCYQGLDAIYAALFWLLDTWNKQGNSSLLILCFIQSWASVWKGQWLTLIWSVPSSDEKNRCQSQSCDSVSRTAQLWIGVAQWLVYASPK